MAAYVHSTAFVWAAALVACSSNTATSSGPSGSPTPVTLGPDLAAPTGTPNTFRCSDGYPIQANATFPQPFFGAGARSCLVLTFIANPNAPTLKSGTALSATLRVTEATGPMRFVRMRILYSRATGAKCCSLEQYGEVFTPSAGATTNVALNFPITIDPTPAPSDPDTIAANDLVALEVLAPDVPIPGYWPQNGGPQLGTATFMWLPALSAQNVPAPSNRLVEYQGSYSGFVPSFTVAYVER